MTGGEESTVEIHGDKWKWIDVRDSIEECRKRIWRKERWKRRDALVDKHGGKVTLFIGQGYDPTKTDFVREGWTHDHCEICWWTLLDYEAPRSDTDGYTNGHDWICTECYEKFIDLDKNMRR